MQQFILMVINLLIFFNFIGCTTNENPKENCTTKVVLFWNKESLLEKKKILNEAFFINVNKDMKNNVDNIPIGEIGTFNNDAWIYFIYASNKKQCEEKVKYTKLSLERYFNVVTGAPKYKIISNISNKELNIITHQNKYNEKKELSKWLNAETKKQLNKE